MRQGRLDSPWEGLVGGVALGDREWAEQLLEGRRVDVKEQPEASRLKRCRRPEWEDIVKASESILGMKWEQMLECHAAWGRDGTMYVAVRFGQHRLAEVVRAVWGLEYAAAVQGVKRFGAAVEKDADRRRFVSEMRRRMSLIKT